jgi:hypothetical protein
MANPISKIKQGISEQKWELICEAYYELTSEHIEIPSSSSTTDDQAVAIILGRWLDKYREVNPSPPLSSNPTETTKKKKRSQNADSAVVLPVDPNKKGYYGNTMVPITDDTVTRSEVADNKKRAAITNKRKTRRDPPKEYDVVCSDCATDFKSDRPDTKDFGQKCRKCLETLISRGRNAD